MSAEWGGLAEAEILQRIADGETLASIAESVERSRSKLSEWLHADVERSARASLARESSAAAWDEKAEKVITDATTKLDAQKARDLAHHYRWRASKILPRVYGEKLDVAHSGTIDLASEIAKARARGES